MVENFKDIIINTTHPFVLINCKTVKRSTLLKAQVFLGFFGFYVNMVSLTPSLMCIRFHILISVHVEIQTSHKVRYGLSNQQMGNALQRGGSNQRPLVELGSNTMSKE